MKSQPTEDLGVLQNSMKRVYAFQIELEFESVGFLRGGETGGLGEKPLGAMERTSNKLNPHMAYGCGMEISVVYHGVIDKNVSGKSDWKMSK